MRLHPAWRVLIYLAICLVCLALTGAVLRSLGFRDPFLPALIGLTLATWLAVRYLDNGRFINLGLAWQPGTPRDLALGLVLPLVLLVSVFALEWAAGWLLVAGVQRVGAAFIIGSVWQFGIIAWYEELFARGYLLQTVERFTHPWIANITTALIFTGLHVANPGFTPAAAGGICLAGLFLGFCFQRTRSLYLPMAFHFSWNFTQVMLGFPVSGIKQEGLLRLVREGPVSYTGGSFGPEGGLLGFLAILIAAGVVRLYGEYRKKPAIV